MSAAKFQFRERLEQTSVPELFQTIYQHRVSGVLEFAQGEVTKRLLIRDGAVVHASSSERGDRLGAYLYRSGLVSKDALRETMEVRAAAGPNKRHGEILIERDLLSPKELGEAIRHQMEDIVWSIFTWLEGEVRFRIGELDDKNKIPIHLPLRRVVLTGVQHLPDTRPLVTKLGKRNTLYRPCYDVEDLIAVGLDRDEYSLLSLVDGKRRLYDICASGPFSMVENARRLYAFYVVGLMERVGERDGLGSGSFKIRLADPSPGHARV